ncbi:hypothetical protein GJV86_11220, partial [Streptococcus pneumoniae]|nr:hypothetical protein [Streptococcus pneumoniae]
MWLTACGSRRWCGAPMPKSRPRCHCGADTKRNGTTGQHSSGWLRKAYATPQNRPSGIPSAAVFIQLLVRIA